MTTPLNNSTPGKAGGGARIERWAKWRAEARELEREYLAKGWPSINPFSRDYCYTPCRFGLHVRGHHPGGMNCLTIANFPTRTAAEAEALFEAAKAELAEPEGKDADFVVDLQLDHDCERDFMMNRQMLSRLEAIALSAAGDQSLEAPHV